MTLFGIWIVLQLPCWMWLAQALRKFDAETSNWVIVPLTFFAAVPACIVILFFGAIFRVMNWAANG